jgi:hypothetical protein
MSVEALAQDSPAPGRPAAETRDSRPAD